MPRHSLFYVSTEGVGCRSFPCRDIRFYVVTGNGHSKGFAVTTELALGRDFVFATKYFMSLNERFCVATGNFRLRYSWPG